MCINGDISCRIPNNVPARKFPPFSLKIVEGKTSPPIHLTEPELITLMDKNGIGTDATIHEHIAKIQKRRYAIKKFNKLVPTNLGTALILGYEKIGLQISYPGLRCKLEADLKKVCRNEKNPNILLKEEIDIYKSVYRQIEGGIEEISQIYINLEGNEKGEGCGRHMNKSKIRKKPSKRGRGVGRGG
ncbi:DNA topoisomerase 3 [Dictyocoela roeselum]|nr:DNA topoisomerase 3 [Dictyocoela roeselum]